MSVDRRSARWLVACYPPGWRARYGDEVLAHLEQSGVGPRGAVSLVGGAGRAWLRPSRSWLAGAARVRASVGTLLVAWIVLATLGVGFGQLNEDQTSIVVTPGHGLTGAALDVFVAASAASMLALAVALVPLFVIAARAAHRRHDGRGVLLLGACVAVPPGFVGCVVLVARFVRDDTGIGTQWFVVLAVLGWLSAAVTAICAVLALRRLVASERAVRLALGPAIAAVVLMGVAIGASVVNLAAVRAWGVPSFSSAPPSAIAGYATTAVVGLVVGVVSARRGLAARAVRAG